MGVRKGYFLDAHMAQSTTRVRGQAALGLEGKDGRAEDGSGGNQTVETFAKGNPWKMPRLCAGPSRETRAAVDTLLGSAMEGGGESGLNELVGRGDGAAAGHDSGWAGTAEGEEANLGHSYTPREWEEGTDFCVPVPREGVPRSELQTSIFGRAPFFVFAVHIQTSVSKPGQRVQKALRRFRCGTNGTTSSPKLCP